MVDRFVSYATGPALRPRAPGAVIRRGANGQVEMVNLAWGLEPRVPGSPPVTHLRAEGRTFEARRCLIPGSQFTVSSGQGRERQRWRVTLRCSDTHFYFAGVWRPASCGWPPSYALITIPAGPDIEPYQNRQVAVILRPDRFKWLDCRDAEASVLSPLPQGRFWLEQVVGPLDRPVLAAADPGRTIGV